MGATLTAAAGQDTSSFTMRGLADTLPAMMTILADVVRNPTFPQAEIDLLKANTTQSLQAQLASPQVVANRVYRQTLFGPHPYARTGATLDTVGNIDRASIVEYHKAHYRSNNAFLIVTGDVAAVKDAGALALVNQLLETKRQHLQALEALTAVHAEKAAAQPAAAST